MKTKPKVMADMLLNGGPSMTLGDLAPRRGTGTLADLVRGQNPIPGIVQDYPRLSGYDWAFIDSRGKQHPENPAAQLEFYPPENNVAPRNLVPTTEVFNQKLKGEMLSRAVLGDMLHYMPRVDPRFESMRQQYARTLTPDQNAIDRDAYAMDKRDYGENRSYDDWFNESRLDAHLRGYLTPDEQDNWRNMYRPQQVWLLENIRDYLKQKP